MLFYSQFPHAQVDSTARKRKTNHSFVTVFFSLKSKFLFALIGNQYCFAVSAVRTTRSESHRLLHALHTRAEARFG